MVITYIIRGLVTPLKTTHEPPSRVEDLVAEFISPKKCTLSVL